MHTATQPFEALESRHTHRKRMARIYLAVISAIILVADLIFLRFVFSDYNPWGELLVGVLVGQMASTPLLIAAIYRRLYWARFVLIGMLFVVLSLFALVAVFMQSAGEYRNLPEIIGIGIGVIMVTIANTWLIRSKRIQHLARMGQIGG
jgi:peptidoglycan/LPS O-acetylase OafA/YrhL